MDDVPSRRLGDRHPGITRNEALKALGNGVVPQQAATALADMLATLRQEHAA